MDDTRPAASHEVRVATTICLVFGAVAAVLAVVTLVFFVVASVAGWTISLLTLVSGVVLASMIGVFSLVFGGLTRTAEERPSGVRLGTALSYATFVVGAALIVLWTGTAIAAS